LAEGKKDKEFKKKPELALELIDKSLARGYQPKIILVDAGYGNNTSFLKELEEREQKYLVRIAKNRKLTMFELKFCLSPNRALAKRSAPQHAPDLGF